MKCNQPHPGFWTRVAVSISCEDNHYTMGKMFRDSLHFFKKYLKMKSSSSTTSTDLILNKRQSLSMTLVWKISNPAKQKSLTWVVIIPCSLFPKYQVNIAWSYFEITAPDFNNSSLSDRYQDLDVSDKPYTHLKSFQIYPGGTLASLRESK